MFPFGGLSERIRNESRKELTFVQTAVYKMIQTSMLYSKTCYSLFYMG